MENPFSPPFNMIFFKSVSSARSNLPQVIFSNVDIQQSDIQNVWKHFKSSKLGERVPLLFSRVDTTVHWSASHNKYIA